MFVAVLWRAHPRVTPLAHAALQVRELSGHTNRVSSLSWNGAILSSGGRDSIVNHWDVRKRKDQALVASLRVHEQVGPPTLRSGRLLNIDTDKQRHASSFCWALQQA